MKRTLFVCLLILATKIIYAQDISYLWNLYNEGYYSEALELALPLCEDYPENPELKLLIGRIYTDQGHFEDAIPYLNFAIEMDINNSWIKGWGLVYAGVCYYTIGEYVSAETNLNNCIALNATVNSSDYARYLLKVFGFDSYYDQYLVIEKEHILFHFHPQSLSYIENVDIYTNRRVEAFDSLAGFFGAELPKKVDYFIWHSRGEAYTLLNRNLGFAIPSGSLIHSYYNQTSGHELTHVISYHMGDNLKTTLFINEGTAVYFDMSNRSKIQMARDAVKNLGYIDIIDIWQNSSLSEEYLYPISGAFIEYLIVHEGKDKFLEFFLNQTIENAYVVYGQNFDQIVDGFEALFSDLVTSNANFLSQDFIIYPNPCRDFFYLKSDMNYEKMVLSIFDLTGKLLLSQTIVQKETLIDISTLNSGTYILKIVTNEEVVLRNITKY